MSIVRCRLTKWLAASWKPSRWFAFANQQAFKPADRINRVSQKTRFDQWAGRIRTKSIGLGHRPRKGIGLAIPLDLVHEFLRQNTSIVSQEALRSGLWVGLRPSYTNAALP